MYRINGTSDVVTNKADAIERTRAADAAVAPRGTIKLVRSRTAKCWLATFWKVDGMPDGVSIPLPFTTSAGVFIVVSDMEARFPDAQIFAS
jgi:hypothetical protein